MNLSPLDRGVSLTLTWCPTEERRQRTVSLGAFLRVGFALALCAACYQVGRWRGALETMSERPAERVAAAVAPVKPVPSANTGTGASGLAAGRAVGEPADVITPLNVRDPSALVMSPAEPAAPTVQPQSEEPPTPEARVFPRVPKNLKPTTRF